MPDKDVDVPKAVLRGKGIELSRPSRTIAFVLGIAALGAGGAAVYLTQLEAGPVGLMAVGLIFMIIALGGVLPTRLKIREGEAEWQAVAGQVIETAVEGSSPAVRAELIDQLGSLAEVAPQAASPALSGFAYQQFIEQILQARLPEITGAQNLRRELMTQVSGRIWAFDFAIEATGNRMLLIEVKASPALSDTNILGVMDRADHYQEASPGYRVGLLLVTRFGLPRFAPSLSPADRPVSFVVVRGPEDQDELVRAINRALAVLDEVKGESD